MKGVNFYQQYGAHDDRPLVSRPKTSGEDLPKEVESQPRRPGEIRFGGMSFALPPPGTYPDMPEEEEEKVSDVFPNHPASEVSVSRTPPNPPGA